MNKLKLAKIFNESIDEYLIEVKPRFDFQRFSLPMVESEIRDYFARKLRQYNYDVQVEIRYPESNLICDIKIILDDKNIYIELKQSAMWTDSIQKKDLTDFAKFNTLMDNLDSNDIKAVFVLNINPKYLEFPQKWKQYQSPLQLPSNNIGSKGLSKFWKKSVSDSDKQYFRFFLREYSYPFPEDLDHPLITREYNAPFKLNAITLCYVNNKEYL